MKPCEVTPPLEYRLVARQNHPRALWRRTMPAGTSTRAAREAAPRHSAVEATGAAEALAQSFLTWLPGWRSGTLTART
eukprot:scaffold223932_cov32-Tisochrysis_lutea.AAC.3